MNVFLDNREIDAVVSKGQTLDDALRHMQTDNCAGGRVVVRLRCDGHDVTSAEMPRILCRPADSFERIEVFTLTRGGLVTEAMEQAETSLHRTDEACKDAGRLINQGQTAEGVETLGECLFIWQQVHEAVAKSIQLLQVDPDTLAVEGESLSHLLGKPKDILMQVRDALEAKDFVLLADLLLYDLVEVTAQWRAIVDRLRIEADDSD